ncbi:MAG: calcium/sodium antiporter [Lachnospiraceae bacterium]|nr:calcium/sodium antiporter [Lachnospiraceae bacterium]
MELFLNIILLIVGFVMLIKGADWFVEGVAGIAEKFGIPQLVIGLTIVAMGTSAPEAAVSITSALKGNAGITIGNVVGSNILNVLIILGLTAIITNVAIQQSTIRYELPFMLVITLVLIGLGMTGGNINLVEGIIMWVLFLVYMAYLFVMAKKGKQENEEAAEDRPIWKLLLMGIIGAALVVVGADFTVDGATVIAKTFGMSDRLIGLTIVALGTSLPELVTSVTAAKKGKADIAIGNIVGSNIFNILFVVGTTALVTPVVFESKFVIDTLIAFAAGIILWIGVAKHKELRRPTGVVMLVAYAAYFVYLLLG